MWSEVGKWLSQGHAAKDKWWSRVSTSGPQDTKIYGYSSFFWSFALSEDTKESSVYKGGFISVSLRHL